jgi:hypothetical protein
MQQQLPSDLLPDSRHEGLDLIGRPSRCGGLQTNLRSRRKVSSASPRAMAPSLQGILVTGSHVTADGGNWESLFGLN